MQDFSTQYKRKMTTEKRQKKELKRYCGGRFIRVSTSGDFD